MGRKNSRKLLKKEGASLSFFGFFSPPSSVKCEHDGWNSSYYFEPRISDDHEASIPVPVMRQAFYIERSTFRNFNKKFKPLSTTAPPGKPPAFYF